MVISWHLAGCTGVIGVSTHTICVTVGHVIGIRLLLCNDGGVALFRRNGSVVHEACYFCCNRCGKLWVSGGWRIGLVLNF